MKMLQELSDEELNRIQRLTDAATAGPWFSCVAGQNGHEDSNCIELGSCNELGCFHCMRLIGGTIADQDFIANAREDVPKLLAEIRTLRKRLDSLRGAQNSLDIALPGARRFSLIEQGITP